MKLVYIEAKTLRFMTETPGEICLNAGRSSRPFMTVHSGSSLNKQYVQISNIQELVYLSWSTVG